MKYEKPEVVELGSASDCIQNNMKGSGNTESQFPHEKSTGAYVADE